MVAAAVGAATGVGPAQAIGNVARGEDSGSDILTVAAAFVAGVSGDRKIEQHVVVLVYKVRADAVCIIGRVKACRQTTPSTFMVSW